MLEQYDEILTVEKACEILRVGKNALYHMLVNKRLKGHGNGRVRRRPKRPISTNPPVPNGTGGFVMMRYAAGVKLLGLLDGSLSWMWHTWVFSFCPEHKEAETTSAVPLLLPFTL